MKSLLAYIFLVSVLCQSVQAEQISVSDFSNREVTIKTAAKRVIAIGPHVVENVFSVGAGDLLVGVIEHSDFPEAALSIQRIGDSQGLSIETITALNPDLILLWRSAYSADVANKLIELGFTVYLDEPKTLAGITKSLADISLLTGKTEEGFKAIAAYTRKLQSLKQKYESKDKLRVFYQIWSEPLLTINGQHIISDVIDLCGGSNIFADANVVAPRVSIESLLQRDPEIIIGTGRGPDSPSWIHDWDKWPSVSAVSKKRIFYVHPDLMHRHTVRLLTAAESVCEFISSVKKR
jgi:iron complex transport system substrate-binding protein